MLRREMILSVALFLVILALWQLAVGFWQIPPWLLPSPLAIAKALWQTAPLIGQHSLTTIVETSVGFSIAVLLGLGAGLVIDLFPLLKRILYPYLIFSQTVPLVAVAPLLILWFGYGLLPKFITVVLVCFFPVTISLIDGLAATDQDMVNLLRSMGAGPWQVFRFVRWPNSLPSLFSGLKIAATYSVMAAVIGEWLGAGSGLGVYLTRASHSFLTDRVFASILVITLLSFLYFGLITAVARLALPWTRTKEK